MSGVSMRGASAVVEGLYEWQGVNGAVDERREPILYLL